MTKIYVIRHCEAEGNLYRRCHGQYDGLLTENGKAQRKCLEQYFNGLQIDRVFSSDLTRAYETARAVARPRGLRAEKRAALREIKLGEWEDLPWGEVSYRYPSQSNHFYNHPHLFYMPGAEKMSQVQERMFAAVGTIARECAGKTVAVVSHGLAVRALFTRLLGLPLERIAEMPHFDNASVSLVEWDDKPSVLFTGYNEHLGDLSTFAKQSWWRSDSKLTDINLRFIPAGFPEDAGEVSFMQEEAWRTVHGNLSAFNPAATLDTAVRMSALDPMSVLFAVNGDRRAGLLTLNPAQRDDASSGHISLAYLTEDMRGRGIGAQLLGQAVSHYRAMGKSYLRLKVAATNQRARRFYEKHGFKPVGKENSLSGALLVLRKSIVNNSDEHA